MVCCGRFAIRIINLFDCILSCRVKEVIPLFRLYIAQLKSCGCYCTRRTITLLITHINRPFIRGLGPKISLLGVIPTRQFFLSRSRLTQAHAPRAHRITTATPVRRGRSRTKKQRQYVRTVPSSTTPSPVWARLP